MAKPTIKEVAVRAGVSPATVSRVVNGDARISAQTRRRVLAAVAALDYRANETARNLKLNRSGVVGFVTPEMANDFFMTVAEAAEATLIPAGYQLMICSSNDDPRREAERVRALLERNVDGLVLIPATDSGELLSFLNRDRTPVVCVDRMTHGVVCDHILVDNSGGVFAAIRRLVELGHHRFGFIGGDLRISPAQERYEGFCRAVETFHCVVRDCDVKFGDFHVHSGYQLMAGLLADDDGPTTVFVSNYYMHIGAIQCLVEQNNERARTLFVAGFDDMMLSNVIGRPSLTIAQPMAAIGRRAAQRILERIQPEPLPHATPPTAASTPRIERLATQLVLHQPGREPVVVS